MSKPISFGKLEVNVVSTMEETRGAPEPETPFRVALLGDFSGRANRGIVEAGSALEGRRFLEVDRDNFDEVMERLGVEVHLSVAGNDSPPVVVRFAELDGFHPEQLFERLEVFQALRNTRKRLNDPRTFEAAAREVRSWTGVDTATGSSESPSEQSTVAPDVLRGPTGTLLDQMLDEAEGGMPETTRLTESSEWDRFLHRIVTPHLVPGDDPEQEELVSAVDVSTSNLMNTILHHLDFQEIEAAWRGVYFLVSRLETNSQLKLYLLDISKAELAGDLSATEELRSTGIFRLLVEQTVETFGGEPWAVFMGNYKFDQSREDAELLGRMAKIASRAGAPFISAANAHVLGCESLAKTPDPDNWQRSHDEEGSQAWEALRKLSEASYLGLALPRFLLRLPYGEDTDPVDYFDFEEMPSDTSPNHDHYLWGNPSFACVYLLAQAFSQYGWDLRPGVIQDIEGLPLHVYKQQDESQVKPCAEVVLTERAAEIMLDKGLMPLLSMRNQDTVRLARFQSLADPLTHLAGPWG